MQRFIYSIIMSCVLLSAGYAHAESTVAQDMHKIAVRNPDKSFVTLSIENDMLGGGSDKFYTSGVQLNYFNVDTKPSPVMHRVAQSWFGYDVGPTTASYFTLGQKIFTPRDIAIASAQPDDRPWAGWLYGTAGLVNAYDNHVDQLGLTIGVVGPPSLAEPSQKFIHEHISDSPEPQGWDNQLHTELGVNVSWDRRWPNMWHQDLVGGYGIQFEPNISWAVGNVNVYGGAGGTLTFGPNQKQLQDTPPRLPPAMPGTGYFSTPQGRDWDWYLFTGINGRVVGRDLFLDGNTFRDSASVDKKYFVADANAGIALTYGATRISYTMVYRTKEFDGQDDPSVFGSVSLTRSF